MKETMRERYERIVEQSRNRRRYRWAIGVVGSIAAIATAAALTMPAIAAVQGQFLDPAATSEQPVEQPMEQADPTATETPTEGSATEKNVDAVTTEEQVATQVTEEPIAEMTSQPESQPADNSDISPMAEIPGEHVDGGTIIGPEDNELTWEVTENDAGERTLTISGEGPMPDYSSTNTPPYQTYLSADGGRSPIALVIGDEVTRVGDSSFTNAYITSIDFGVGVGSIGASAFDHLHSLTSLYIPGNVKVIEDYAFQLTYVLRHVELAEGVQAIGNGAFESNVNSLEGTPEEGTLKIPASLTSIGTSALGRIFYAYEVDPGNPNYSSVDGVLYSKDGSKLIDYPSLRTADEFIVPATVKTIAEGAFKATYRTNSFVIPHTVESISGDAFRECSNLREVYIEDGVNVIAPSLMFYMCKHSVCQASRRHQTQTWCHVSH